MKWQFDIDPEDESYQAVYGRSKANERIEAKTRFVHLALRDRRGQVLASLGFVEDNDESIRYHESELQIEALPQKLYRATAKRRGMLT